MSEPPIPAAVEQAQREQRRFVMQFLMPSLSWILVSTIVILPFSLKALSGSELEQMGLVALWLLGMAAAVAHMVRGGTQAQSASQVLAAWSERQAERAVAGILPAASGSDPLLDGLIARAGTEVGDLARRCREGSRGLREQAAAARAALAGLPPEGEGALALAAAAQQAEQRATQIDDQLAALYAQSLSGSLAVGDALEQLRALVEVERAEKAEPRVETTQRELQARELQARELRARGRES